MDKKEELKQKVEEKETTKKTETKKQDKVKEVKKEETKKETNKNTTKKEEPKTTTETKAKKEEVKTEIKKESNKEPVKKSAPKKDTKKENKKSNVKTIGIIVLAVIIIAAIACAGYFITLNIMEKSALKEVDTVFSAMKSGDEETLKQYLDEDDSSDTEEATDESSEEMAKTMLSGLNYEIISADTNLKECIVKLNISNKDLKTVFENYMKKAFSLAFSQAFGQKSEDEMNEQLQKYFEEQYNSDSIETKTNELTITMTRENGKWNMNADKEEVINCILPGYEDVMESLSSMGD